MCDRICGHCIYNHTDDRKYIYGFTNMNLLKALS